MKQLLIMFLCAFLFACTSANKGRIGNEQDITIIDLSDVKYSEEPSKLSEFVESISYIRLDDTPLIPDLLFTGIAVIDGIASQRARPRQIIIYFIPIYIRNNCFIPTNTICF